MKSELQTLPLFNSILPYIYRKSQWGDIDDYREDLTAGEVLEYEDSILALIQKENLSSEGELDLAVYLDDNLSQKVHSIKPSVEKWNGELWGVTEVQTHGKLSPSEPAELTDCPLNSVMAEARGWNSGKSRWMTVICISAFGIPTPLQTAHRR